MIEDFTNLFPEQDDCIPLNAAYLQIQEVPMEAWWLLPTEKKDIAGTIRLNNEVESFDTTDTSQRKASFNDDDDLNKKVDLIIANSRTFKKRKHADKKPVGEAGRLKKCKIRKTQEQMEALKKHLRPNCAWSKQEISFLAKVTGLTELQVYKWSWDKSSKKAE